MSAADWTDATIAQLRVLWAKGLSTAEIGQRLAVSKNAIVGKAHRLELTARPSPIRAKNPAVPRKPSGPMPVPKLADIMPMPSLAAATPTEDKPSQRAPAAPKPLSPPRAPAAKPVPRQKSEPPVLTGRTSACRWPIGEPGTQGFRFCGATSLPGRPYCEEHAGIAYVRPSDRHEQNEHKTHKTAAPGH